VTSSPDRRSEEGTVSSLGPEGRDLHAARAMSMAAESRCSPEWLALREPADAEARAGELIPPLRAYLGGPLVALRAHLGGPLVIRDLACGTGSMGRWLAGRLPGPQHWILTDHDAGLLSLAAAGTIGPDAGSRPVTVATECRDLTQIHDLAGTSLVTASALLDLLTAGEVDRLAATCAEADCAALLTLSVTGNVRIDPPNPLDAEVEDAFNAHQRRIVRGRRLLGPDAPGVAAEAFELHGMTVGRHPSPWRLDGSALTAEWLTGRAEAAGAQRPGLPVRAYLRRRLEQCAAGELRAVVEHHDLLALPER
jgi:hypothetical protein